MNKEHQVDRSNQAAATWDGMQTVDLLRHGDVEGGTRLLGWADLALSELGWQQLRAATRTDEARWDCVIASPLRRCREFAEVLTQELGIPLMLESGFKEIGFGDWEGRLIADLRSMHADEVERFWSDPAHQAAPGGEPFDEFESRVTAAWTSLWDAPPGAHILVVSHGGTIRTLLRQVLGFPTDRFFRIDVPYAGLSRIRRVGRQPPRLVFHNGAL